MTDQAPQKFTVSGPGLDKEFPGHGPCLSIAITYASRGEDGVTYYIREKESGVARFRVERTDGIVFTTKVEP